MSRPSAAKGHMPFKHRTCEHMFPGYQRPTTAPRSGYVEREPRNRFADTLAEVTDDEIVEAVQRAWKRTAA